MFIQEDYFKNIFNTVREGILILDENMKVLSANRSFFTIFKVDSVNTIGTLLYDLGNGQWNIPYLRVLLEDILPKNDTVDDYEIEHTFETIGKKTMLLNACKIREKKNDLPIILLAIEDISERKRLEDLLVDSEERYRRLFETASDGIVLLEKREGKITHVNPATEKMLGYSEKESIGKKLRDIGVALTIDDFSEIMHALNINGIINYENVLLQTKSGQDIYADIYMVDRAMLAQCNIRDVTKRKKLEEQLRCSQKMESIGKVAGGIAHDFNNILTAIIGYASVMQMKMKMPKDDPLWAYLEQILSSAEKAAVLTQSLLAFSRKQISNPKPVNLNEIVKKAEKFLSRVIGEDIELKMILSDNGLTVMADSGQIEQVLMNLAINAKDAMPKGGALTIQTEPVEFDSEFIKTIGYGEVGKYACITISDTGIGMGEAIREKIFEPLFTTKEVGKGTGLGLSIVYGIIKQHNGNINCYSELGKGTTFKIYFPLESKPVSKTVTEGTVVAVTTGGTETILLAEDEESVRKLMREVLEENGYKVIEAADGEEAVNKFMENKDRIDLLLLDIIMPKMSGREVYERIKKIKPDVKLLMTSGYPVDFISQAGIFEGGVSFVSKPMSPTNLLVKVREVLDR